VISATFPASLVTNFSVLASNESAKPAANLVCAQVRRL